MIISFFVIAESINWFSLLLDELFFSSYKKIKIISPLYISGIPRTVCRNRKALQGDKKNCCQKINSSPLK